MPKSKKPQNFLKITESMPWSAQTHGQLRGAYVPSAALMGEARKPATKLGGAKFAHAVMCLLLAVSYV